MTIFFDFFGDCELIMMICPHDDLYVCLPSFVPPSFLFLGHPGNKKISVGRSGDRPVVVVDDDDSLMSSLPCSSSSS